MLFNRMMTLSKKSQLLHNFMSFVVYKVWFETESLFKRLSKNYIIFLESLNLYLFFNYKIFKNM